MRQPVDVAGAEGRVALQSEHAHLFLYDSRSCRNILKPLQFTPPRMGGGAEREMIRELCLGSVLLQQGKKFKEIDHII